MEPIIDSGLSTIESVAVDWLNKKIYWVESHADLIEVAEYDGTLRTTVVQGNMSNPRSLCLDPIQGFLLTPFLYIFNNVYNILNTVHTSYKRSQERQKKTVLECSMS